MALVLLRRLGEMVFVMAGISVLVFLIFFATPGADPAARIAGRNASPEVLAAVRHDFGFDQPLWVQYLLLMKRLFITGFVTTLRQPHTQRLPAEYLLVHVRGDLNLRPDRCLPFHLHERQIPVRRAAGYDFEVAEILETLECVHQVRFIFVYKYAPCV